MSPVFLGAEDHPPRNRRPKCLTGSAITLVRSARPNPRGRHARVADPSGVECQRDGSDQGQRMKAGDGALTSDRSLTPSRDAHRSPAVPQLWSRWIGVVRTGKKGQNPAADEYGRAVPLPWKAPGIRPKRRTCSVAILAAPSPEPQPCPAPRELTAGIIAHVRCGIIPACLQNDVLRCPMLCRAAPQLYKRPHSPYMAIYTIKFAV